MNNSTNVALAKIQQNLIAPKNQRNTFGKYNYRSCEDIMEAVKPLLAEFGATLTVTDTLVMIGERYYVKATATLCAIAEGAESVSVDAYARESAEKKGMDDSQITGSTSSYARKYALNGLFCIDDTKDADAIKKTRTKKSEDGTSGAAKTANKSATQKSTAPAVSEELKTMRQNIANTARKLINAGVSRDKIDEIVAKNNNGKRNPNTVSSVDTCIVIIAELTELGEKHT